MKRFLLVLLLAASLLGIANRRVPPTLALQSLENTQIKGQSLRGKTTVMQFWGSWCQSCAGVTKEILNILKSDERFNNVFYASVGTDDQLVPVQKYVAKQKSQIPAARINYFFDRSGKIGESLGMKLVPTVLVVDANGRILSKVEGHLDRRKIAEITTNLRVAISKEYSE